MQIQNLVLSDRTRTGTQQNSRSPPPTLKKMLPGSEQSSSTLPQDQVGPVTGLGVISALACVLWVLIQFSKYARRDSPRVYLAVVGISWWLGVVGVVVLLPVDLALAKYPSESTSGTMMTIWKFEYWTTFMLSWAVCPLMMEYWASGAFTVKARLWEALKSNLRFYLTALLILILLAIALALTRGFDAFQLTGYLLAAANCYGMLLIVVMLGYGLIELPRLLQSRWDRKLALKSLYFSAPLIEGEKLDAESEVVDVVKSLSQFARNSRSLGPQLESHARYVCDKVPEEYKSLLESTHSGFQSSPVSEKELIRLHAALKKALIGYDRVMDTWDELMRDIVREEKRVAESEQQHTLGVGIPQEGIQQSVPCLGSKAKLKSMLSIRGILFVCAVLFSAVLFWCECNAPFGAQLSVFGAAINSAETAFSTQLTSLVPLLYMAACAYTALFKFKMLDGLALHRNNHTDVYCLLYNASYLGRLQFALGINFAAMLFPELMQGTQFNTLMGNTDVAPFLGSDFNQYIPILMIVVALMTWFRALDKVRSIPFYCDKNKLTFVQLLTSIGVEVHEEPRDTPEHRDRIQEGMALIRRAQQRNGRGINSLSVNVESERVGLLGLLPRWLRGNSSYSHLEGPASMSLTQV